jgi:uncharacterized membrane protein YfhO
MAHYDLLAAEYKKSGFYFGFFRLHSIIKIFYSLIQMSDRKFKELKYLSLLLILIVFISGYLFKDFLLGKKLYIYADIGKDTLNNYWPFYSYLIDAIKSNQLSFWLFQDGLGNNIFSNADLIFDPFNIILLFFNKHTLPYAFGYIAVIKIILAGLFFYLYLSCFNLMPYVKVAGSLLYAFNGYMILWGQHYQSATVVVFLPLLLFSYEKLIIDNFKLLNALFFIFLVSFYYLFNLYFMYQITIFLFLYFVLKFIFSEKLFFNYYIVKPTLLYILGFGISAALSFPAVYIYLNSPRIGGNNFDFSLFTPNIFSTYAAILSRFFSNDISLSKSLCSGYDPSLYAGILPLMVTPFLYSFLNKRKKITFIFCCILYSAFIFFPFLSRFMNAFSAVNYRWTFIIVTINLLSFSFSLDYLLKINKLNLKLLLIISLIYIFFSILLYNISNKIIIYFFIILFIFLYLNLLIFLFISKKKFIPKLLLIILIGIELIYASYGCINNRELIDASSLKEKTGYLDFTNDAISFLNEKDSDLYRIDKSYFSVSLRDSLIQNYKGTSACNSLNNPGTMEFYHYLKLPFLFGVICNLSGFDSRQNLQTLAGVKYFLTKTGHAIPFGYEYVNTFGDVHIFRNNYYLPIGFTYDAYIPFDKFISLPSYQKDEILLKACVLDIESSLTESLPEISTESINNYLSPKQATVIKQDNPIILNGSPVELFKNTSFDKKDSTEQMHFNHQLNLQTDKYTILLKAKIQLRLIIISDKETEGKLSWKIRNASLADENSIIFKIKKDWWKYYFGELYGSDDFWWGTYHNTYDLNVSYSQLEGLSLEALNEGGRTILKKYEIVAKVPQDMTCYVEDIKKLRKNIFQIRKHSNDYIAGDIVLDKNKLLFLSIPYDKGWQAKVDGKAADIEKINIGFMGLLLNRGFHSIELQYVPPFLITGVAVSLLSLIILIVVVALSLRKQL